jgi:hypothetical protein
MAVGYAVFVSLRKQATPFAGLHFVGGCEVVEDHQFGFFGYAMRFDWARPL